MSTKLNWEVIPEGFDELLVGKYSKVFCVTDGVSSFQVNPETGLLQGNKFTIFPVAWVSLGKRPTITPPSKNQAPQIDKNKLWKTIPKAYVVLYKHKYRNELYCVASSQGVPRRVDSEGALGDPFILDHSLWTQVGLRPITEETNLGKVDEKSAFRSQVGGDHYKTLGIQPLELALKNFGYQAFVGACFTKINKYITRKKDNEVEQLKKARHVLDMWIEKAEKESNDRI